MKTQLPIGRPQSTGSGRSYGWQSSKQNDSHGWPFKFVGYYQIGNIMARDGVGDSGKMGRCVGECLQSCKLSVARLTSGKNEKSECRLLRAGKRYAIKQSTGTPCEGNPGRLTRYQRRDFSTALCGPAP